MPMSTSVPAPEPAPEPDDDQPGLGLVRTITVPDAHPGRTICINLPTGQQLRLQVPPGVRRGQPFTVVLRAPARLPVCARPTWTPNALERAATVGDGAGVTHLPVVPLPAPPGTLQRLSSQQSDEIRLDDAQLALAKLSEINQACAVSGECYRDEEFCATTSSIGDLASASIHREGGMSAGQVRSSVWRQVGQLECSIILILQGLPCSSSGSAPLSLFRLAWPRLPCHHGGCLTETPSLATSRRQVCTSHCVSGSCQNRTIWRLRCNLPVFFGGVL